MLLVFQRNPKLASFQSVPYRSDSTQINSSDHDQGDLGYWALVKEFDFRYHYKETIIFTVDPYHGT